MMRLIKICFLFFGTALTFQTSSSLADDFNALSQEADRAEYVNVLVSGGWNPVTGAILPEDLSSAITGAIDLDQLQDDFVQNITARGGQAEKLYSFKYFPFALVRMDKTALQNTKALASNVDVWRNAPLGTFLSDSTKLIDAPRKWASNFDGSGQVVAVLDSGVNADHPMLQGQVVYEACVIFLGCEGGKSVRFGPGSSSTETVHGTHVAGIIAGHGQISGVAPGAKIASFKVLGEDGAGGLMDMFIALDYVLRLKRDRGMNIVAINMS
ncbi:MAG: S8 family serine peptidase, partial [Alphaproteobacteria bacterium]|nr:S8 family serine peptidase [Alphaproteobacteria bacterium]